MKIEIRADSEADSLLQDPQFRQQWKKLYDQCSWGSVYQSEDFVLTWYSTYRCKFTPVIVLGTNKEGELIGLFTLATSVETGQLVVAGSIQAEYQGWLAEQEGGDVFIERALDKLRERFPQQNLTLLFMLPSVPVGWTKPGQPWSTHCHVRTMRRGLLKIGDGSSFKDTLRKKKQSKINRLKRLGNLHLDRIQTPEELEAIFDEVVSYQTLRLRAIQNLPHVEPDPLKKAFHVKLMSFSRMIHATALRVDDKLVSAQFHRYNKEQVILDLITHSPFYGRYSPGELHLLMVGAELAEEQIPVFDLTPGGNYKDRYATHYDEVFIITIFFNRAHCTRYKFKRGLAETAKAVLEHINITPERTREFYLDLLDWRQKWRRLKPMDILSELLRRLKRSLWHSQELYVYKRDLNHTIVSSDLQPMRRDYIPDLLTYQPTEAWQPPVNKFMKLALERLEAGHHIYTRVEDGRLVQYGWMIEPQGQKQATGIETDITLPPDSILLTDFYTFSQGYSLPESSIYQMLGDAMDMSTAKHVCIYVRSDNFKLRELTEELGLRYQYRLISNFLFWRATNWFGVPEPID